MIRAFYLFGFVLLLTAKSVVSQPYNLQLVGSWNNPHLRDRKGQIFNDIWGYTDPWGREYAILGSVDSIYFIDVTNPAKPRICDVEAGKDSLCIHRDFKTYEHYCYAVADEGHSSLQIFDLQYLPDSVHKVYDSDVLTLKTHNIFIADDLLFLASNYHTQWGPIAMSIISLANPENPVAISHVGASKKDDSTYYFNKVHDVFVRDHKAYCSNGGSAGVIGGLYVYNVDTKASLDYSIIDYPDKGYNHSSWLTDNNKFIVFADETHGLKLKCFDISQDGKPKFVSTFGSHAGKGSIPHNPFIVGDMCFVSYYHDGVVVFDLTDKQDIKKVAFYDTYPENDSNDYSGFEGCWGVYPFFSSGTIIASDMSHGLFVFKLEGWETPIKPENEQMELFRTNIVLYPNPTNDRLQLVMPDFYQGQYSYLISDMVGKQMALKTGDLKGYSLTIDSRDLSLGVYYLKVILGEQSLEYKFLKTN